MVDMRNNSREHDEFSPITMNKALKEWVNWQIEMRARRAEKKRQIAQRYGRAIKVQRARRGLGQRSLATRLGINVTVLAKIETGVILPSPRIHAALLRTLEEIPETRPRFPVTDPA
jgi:ribosome-binding protein aMBF1 (putative translation factor)